MHVTTIGANGAVRNAIHKLDVEKCSKRSMQLNTMLPEPTVSTDLAVERLAAHGNGTVFAFESGRATKKVA